MRRACVSGSGSIRIGTAGWSIAKDCAPDFPFEGAGLERYSAVFPCVEINSSFHRPHRASTWERWRDSVPTGFRFAVKLPKTVTRVARLVGTEEAVAAFLAEVSLLGERLAVLLVQLPPSLAFDRDVARAFFTDLTARTVARTAVEPRHESWFTSEAETLLGECQVSRVGADPARAPGAARPLVVNGLAYWRLHGSPVMYRSSYSDRIDALAEEVGGTAATERWCIFDNTASSAATGDALGLMRALSKSGPETSSG